MKKLSAVSRRAIALKAIRTMKQKYGAGVFTKLGKKAWRTRRNSAGQ